jgi:hypothetical protein
MATVNVGVKEPIFIHLFTLDVVVEVPLLALRSQFEPLHTCGDATQSDACGVDYYIKTTTRDRCRHTGKLLTMRCQPIWRSAGASPRDDLGDI